KFLTPLKPKILGKTLIATNNERFIWYIFFYFSQNSLKTVSKFFKNANHSDKSLKLFISVLTISQISFKILKISKISDIIKFLKNKLKRKTNFYSCKCIVVCYQYVRYLSYLIIVNDI